MLWDPILKKNLLKSALASPMNSAQDPHKKCSCQHKCKHSCIQTNTRLAKTGSAISQERNPRIFKARARNESMITNVRARLSTFRGFKPS